MVASCVFRVVKTDNLLIHGDILDGLKYLIDDCELAGKVDLVYIDPPFATGLKFLVTTDRVSTISQVNAGTLAYADELRGADFLRFLTVRLELLRELLSERGSIYLHIDYKIGHYVKEVMDGVFGEENFRNDITRIKCNPKNFARVGYGNVKDLILFYSKGARPIWHEPRLPFTDEEIVRLYPKVDAAGRRYTTVPLHAPGETKNGPTGAPFRGMAPPAGRHWRADVATMEKWDADGLIEWSSNGVPRKKKFADKAEGKRVQDVWEFKDPQYPTYPTEKNLDMLKLIVSTSSEEGGIVLDAFCGSGTTLYAAELLNRKWIGIDQSSVAIRATKQKLGLENSGTFLEKTWRYIDLQANLSVR